MKFATSLILGLFIFASCSTVYRCGELRPENFNANKKVTALVNERDSLCTNLAKEEADNAELTASVEKLQSDYQELQSQSYKTEEELSAALKAKSKELNDKEQTLEEREQRLSEMQAVIARQDSITNRLNSVLRDALLGFADDELSVEMKNGKVYVSMSDKLLFNSGSAKVEEKGQEAIGALSNVLKKNRDIDVLIEGHTDSIPIKTSKYQDNWDLSTARASSIVRLMADEHNINEKRLTAAGRGEFQPRASNKTKEGRAKNRRTEIILSPKLNELMNLLGS
jgi:chemotaxis protein MotB